MKSPLVLNPEAEPEVNVEQVKQKIKQKIPNDYIPIKLESNGKLTAPRILHFRDYTMDDALELNVHDPDDQLKALITVLNNMVFEEFDCSNLHVKELIQILYTIQGTFISSKIEKEYYVNLDLPEGTDEGQLDHPSNTHSIDINISKLKVQNIDETLDGKTREKKFSEPFTLTDTVKKTKMKFRLSRIGDLLFAKEYCDQKYETELFKYRPLKREIYKISQIKNKEDRVESLNKVITDNPDDYEEYMKFLNTYDKYYVRIIQALQVVSVNDVVCDTIEKQIEAYKTNISETLWQMYNSISVEYNFGLLDEYTFYSEEVGTNITRKFQFEFMDFLPNPDKDYSKRYTVQFD